MHYILVTRHDDLWLVGPFVADTAAADYGATAERRRWAEDPRWQTISLSDTYSLRVEAPDRTLNIQAGAYKRACAPAAPLGNAASPTPPMPLRQEETPIKKVA